MVAIRRYTYSNRTATVQQPYRYRATRLIDNDDACRLLGGWWVVVGRCWLNVIMRDWMVDVDGDRPYAGTDTP